MDDGNPARLECFLGAGLEILQRRYTGYPITD